MNYREKIREAIKCPQFGNETYGEWGALRYEQRVLIKRLLDELDDADNLILILKKENQELKKQLKELESIVTLSKKRNLINKFNKEYDEEDKKKNPDRNHATIIPDAEEVYRRYYAMKTQQKEFIEWLENESKEIIRDAGYHQKICIDILEKYKEIIGVEK